MGMLVETTWGDVGCGTIPVLVIAIDSNQNRVQITYDHSASTRYGHPMYTYISELEGDSGPVKANTHMTFALAWAGLANNMSITGDLGEI